LACSAVILRLDLASIGSTRPVLPQ
jgi:hypothetical protein